MTGLLVSLKAMLAHDFIAHAFLAGTVIALAAGLIGYFVVLRNQVFAGDALSHVAFTGAMAALALGVEPMAGLFAATLVVAMGMALLGGQTRSRDSVVGTVFAWVLGLGALFLSVYTNTRSSSNGSAGVNVLFGSIFGLSSGQTLAAAVLGGATVCLLVAIGRPLLFASIAPDVAAARGIPVRTLGALFMLLLGLTVGEAVQAIGALLIFGLLVAPAATAQRLTARPYVALALSAAISVGSVWAGLTLSYRFSRLPPSFLVVALAFAAYFGVVAGSEARRRWGRRRGAGDAVARPVVAG